MNETQKKPQPEEKGGAKEAGAMRLVDSHCHLNFEPLGEQLADVVEEAVAAGVGWMLCITVKLQDFKQILDIHDKYPNIFVSLGVHPNEQDDRDAPVTELISLGSDPRVVAIGETGLDYFRSHGDLEWQRQRFIRHIEAAIAVNKPLIIHTREAMDDTMTMLERHDAAQCGGVMHCFSGDWQQAQRALDLGFYLSFSGIVSFASAAPLRAVAARVPRDRMLIETDAPYLAPAPYRGKPNRPAYVRRIAEVIAEVRGVALEEVAEFTTDNFFKLFRGADRGTGEESGFA